MSKGHEHEGIATSTKIVLECNPKVCSCAIDWSKFRTYLVTDDYNVFEWHLKLQKHGEDGGMTTIKKLPHSAMDFKISHLEPGTKYQFQLSWTRNRPGYTGADKDWIWYMDNKNACSFLSFTTTQGNTLAAPHGFEEGSKVWKSLFDDIRKINLEQENKHLNILLVGNAGSGKTSFLNTLATCFNYKGFKSEEAVLFPELAGASAAAEKGHISEEFKSKKVGNPRETRDSKNDLLENVDLWDTWGFSKKNYLHKQLTAILSGQIKEGWRRVWKWPDEDDVHPNLLRELKPGKKEHPLNVRMHAVIFFVTAREIYEEVDHKNEYYVRIRELAKECTKFGTIPIVLVSKVDEVDKTLVTEYKKLFTSDEMTEVYSNLKNGAGFVLTQMFPCSLYNSQRFRDIHIEITAMSAFHAALQKAREYRDNTLAQATKKTINEDDIKDADEQKLKELEKKAKEAQLARRTSKIEREDDDEETPSKSKKSPKPAKESVSPRKSKRPVRKTPKKEDEEDEETEEIEGEGEETPGDEVTSWNVKGVVKWLRSTPYSKYAAAFEKEKITGSQLLELDTDGLKELGVSGLDRARVLALIGPFKKKP